MTPAASSSTKPVVVREPTATAASPTLVENTHEVIQYRRLQNGHSRRKEGGGLIILEE